MAIRIVVPNLPFRLKASIENTLIKADNWYCDNRDRVWYPVGGIAAILATGFVVIRFLS